MYRKSYAIFIILFLFFGPFAMLYVSFLTFLLCFLPIVFLFSSFLIMFIIPGKFEIANSLVFLVAPLTKFMNFLLANPYLSFSVYLIFLFIFGLYRLRIFNSNAENNLKQFIIDAKSSSNDSENKNIHKDLVDLM